MYTIQSLVVVLAAFGEVSARAVLQGEYQWEKPTADDSRSPCPALNALANHGYLPHNGKAISAAMFTQSIINVYNIDTTFARFLSLSAIPSVTNASTLAAALTTGTTLTIDLAALNQHDAIEHDASLTRNDLAQGDNHNLQPALLDALLADSPSDFLTPASLARSRIRREATSLASGSKRPLSAKATSLAYGEAALLLQAFGVVGNGTAGAVLNELQAPKAAVREWFADERLPSGYVKPVQAISSATTAALAATIQSFASRLRMDGAGGASAAGAGAPAAPAAAGGAGGGSVLAELLASLKRLFGW